MTSEELDRLAELRAAYEASGKTINEEDAWQAWTSSIHSAAPELIALAKWAERAKATFNTLANVSHSEQLVVEICEAALSAYPGQAR